MDINRYTSNKNNTFFKEVGFLFFNKNDRVLHMPQKKWTAVQKTSCQNNVIPKGATKLLFLKSSNISHFTVHDYHKVL